MTPRAGKAVHWELWFGLLPFTLLLVLFLLGPLVLTPLLTFQETEFYRLKWTWSLETWKAVLASSSYLAVIARTVAISLLSAIICVIIAYPIAYALATRLKRLALTVQILIVFAFLTDAVLKTFGWVLFLDRHGLGNWLFSKLGFGDGVFHILFTPSATLLGIVYNLATYPIFTVYLSMMRIDPDLKHAAYDAGAGKLRTFFKITFPLTLPGGISGGILAFVLSLGAFLESKVMGGGTKPLASELIRQTFETRVNWPLGAALTTLLVVIAALSLAMLGYAAIRFRRERAAEGAE